MPTYGPSGASVNDCRMAMQVVFPALLLSVVGVISFQTRSPGNPEQQKATHQSKAKMKGRLSRNLPKTPNF